MLSKWKFKGSNLIYCIFWDVHPYQSVLIRWHSSGRAFTCYATIPGLILVHVIYGHPDYHADLCNYYAGVPNQLVESGTVNGRILGIYRNIVLPLCRCQGSWW